MDARQIPTLLLANGSGKSAVLEPRGLWIIGANGRVDMKCGPRHYLIVDVVANFEAPQWQAASVEQRLDRVARRLSGLSFEERLTLVAAGALPTGPFT